MDYITIFFLALFILAAVLLFWVCIARHRRVRACFERTDEHTTVWDLHNEIGKPDNKLVIFSRVTLYYNTVLGCYAFDLDFSERGVTAKMFRPNRVYELCHPRRR